MEDNKVISHLKYTRVLSTGLVLKFSVSDVRDNQQFPFNRLTETKAICGTDTFYGCHHLQGNTFQDDYGQN